MTEKGKRRLESVLAGAAIGGATVLQAKQDQKRREREAAWEAAHPGIARPGQKVVALEDVSGDGIFEDIVKGRTYTVKSLGLDTYTFEECGPAYNPYLGEEGTPVFNWKYFRKLEEQ